MSFPARQYGPDAIWLGPGGLPSPRQLLATHFALAMAHYGYHLR